MSGFHSLRNLPAGRPAIAVTPGPLGTPCWLWLGCLNSKGYAVRGTKHGRYLVHRRVYEEAGGTIGQGAQTHHVCQQRRCVNPEHLRVFARQADHARAHSEGGTICEHIVALLADGIVRTTREIFAAVDVELGSLRATLSREARRGTIRHVARGRYAACQDEVAA